MGDKMKEFKRLLSEGNYSALYEKLENMHFHYELEGFTKIFKGVSSEKKYAYLTYVIARAETPDLHLLMCDFLSYTDTFFFDMYTVQKWHLERALEISPNNINVLQWIVDIFSNHPDSPFTEKEMYAYKELLDSMPNR